MNICVNCNKPRTLNPWATEWCSCRGWTYGIAEVCCLMHCHNCGSGDTLSDERVKDLWSWLQHRLTYWQPSIKSTEIFDNAVQALVVATLAETKLLNITRK